MEYAYRLKDIKYAYGKTLALCLPELNIQAGKITALIGPNGCGKSTLLNLLSFVVHNQKGEIQCFSEISSKQNLHSLTKRVALLPQKPYMLKGSVLNNLNLALQFRSIKKEERADLISTTLEKLNITPLSQKQAKTLSGGELQKVALARAIITNPDILLMDEPFSYLDYASEQTLESFICSYVGNNNKTLVFSTHNRLQGVAIADNVISLVKGKAVKTPLINVFHGCSKKQLFDTGKIQMVLADNDNDFQHVSIDPRDIVLSKEPVKSSMRNQYQGQVLAITDEANKIRITIDAGELFQVLITYQALKELNVSLTDKLWVNFKSNAIVAF